MGTTTTTTKKKRYRKNPPMPKVGLLNWPPSRGPMPDAMRKKPIFTVPPVEVELIELSRSKRGFRVPEVPLPRIKRPVVPPCKHDRARAKRDASMRAAVVMTSAKRADGNAQRGHRRVFRQIPYLPCCQGRPPEKIHLRLNAHVAMSATLKPAQWDLVGGASRGGLRRLITDLLIPGMPRHRIVDKIDKTHALVFDLTYPLSKIARVTIRPYKRTFSRGNHVYELSVGYVLWQLARAYKIIYRQHRRYGVWGHAITDLAFECLSIKDNIGDVGIGS